PRRPIAKVMESRDGTDGVSRLTDAVALRTAYEGRRARLARTFEVREFALSDEVTDLTQLDTDARGTATALGAGLQQLLDRHERREVAADEA
ncbi:MAG TPA: hypothetical protein PKN08_02560, partial [Opitutaceae bacterium]|nr:hypothetical protein [Opitutaceae bacterium]